MRKQLQAPKRRVERVYFLVSGVASIVANGDTPIEVGMIGREGMTGTAVVLGNRDNVSHEIYMQVAGNGRHMPAARLREAIAKSVSLHQVLLGFVQAFLTQTTQTALANGRSKMEDRLARWLLVDDRIDGDEIKLRHARRPTVGHNERAAGARAQGSDHPRRSRAGHHRPRRSGGKCAPDLHAAPRRR